jgi:hypothetical protein
MLAFFIPHFRYRSGAFATGSSRQVGITTPRDPAPVSLVVRYEVVEPAEKQSPILTAAPIFQEHITAPAVFFAAIFQRQRRGILRQENLTCYFGYRSTGGRTGTNLDRAPSGV